MVTKFFEFVESDFSPIKSLYLKDDLNSKIWTRFSIDEKIKENLITISKDFFKSTEIEATIIDIILCGSLCNYNWSENYSDYDVHIIIDFSEINDDIILVEKLCDYAKKQWNLQNDITIRGYEVEISIQDKLDLDKAIKSNRMGGVFSLLNNEWIKKPKKENFTPDEDFLKRKLKSIMQVVDGLSEKVNRIPYEKFKPKIDKIWKKIKKIRLSGLEENGEFGIGNLLFKLLRRNGYIGKIMKLKKDSYSKQFESIDDNLLTLCYLLDDLKSKIINSEDHYTNLDYKLQEDEEVIEIEYSTQGYSDSFNEKIIVHYNTTPINVEFSSSEHNGFGDVENTHTKEYASFDDLIIDIKLELPNFKNQ